MAEEYTLTTPETKPPTVKYQVVLQVYDWESQSVIFRLRGDDGKILDCSYGGPTSNQAGKDEATKLMRQLNTGNFSTKSLQKTILQKLGNDGKIPPGTVTGAPDPV